jgi:hypothetical protein
MYVVSGEGNFFISPLCTEELKMHHSGVGCNYSLEVVHVQLYGSISVRL